MDSAARLTEKITYKHEYLVIQATSTTELALSLLYYLDRGWEVCGGVAITPGREFLQAIQNKTVTKKEFIR